MKTVLVILAGGQATRMDGLAKVTPKSLFPVFNTTLLKRQIQQALLSGLKDIVVSTNNNFYGQIKLSLSDFKNVTVINNPLHKKGSMDALLKIIASYKNYDRVIMSFADIYFRSNPYENFKELLSQKHTFLLVAKPFIKPELAKGGIVFSRKYLVTKVVERSLPGNRSGLRWSGIAILDPSVRKILRDFLKKHQGLTEEDFFEYFKDITTIRTAPSPDFINVNGPQQLLLASLYQAAESLGNGKINVSNLKKTANDLRKQILNGGSGKIAHNN